MRNNRLTASYIKDILDYMDKYHLTSVTINKKYRLFSEIVNDRPLFCFYEIKDYENNKGLNGISTRDKKEFLEKFKNSKYYKIETLEEGEVL